MPNTFHSTSIYEYNIVWYKTYRYNQWVREINMLDSWRIYCIHTCICNKAYGAAYFSIIYFSFSSFFFGLASSRRFLSICAKIRIVGKNITSEIIVNWYERHSEYQRTENNFVFCIETDFMSPFVCLSFPFFFQHFL